MRKELLKLKIDGYLKDGDVYEDKGFSALVPYYITKARHNLLTANLLNKISEEVQNKRLLSIPDDYAGYDWVIGAGYYAMYHIATALLGVIRIRTKSHESLINALEYQFVHKQKLLETEFIKKISEAKTLEEHYVNKMWTAKSRRTIAHYRAEKEISRKDANKVLDNATKFVDRLHQLILQLQEEQK